MANVYLALYKGKKTGINPTALLARFSDWITRKLTKGPYSHCEIAVERIEYTSGHHYEHELHYDCYSSSIRDGGVRCKEIDLAEKDKWDLVLLDGVSEAEVKFYFNATKGSKYDWWGAIGIVLGIKQKRSKYFCSEWCFNAITGKTQGWRFSPNQLAAIFKKDKQNGNW